MAAITQTVAIVNQSGKVVKSSKHLVNVFKEARSAYRERKAELRAVRDAELDEKRTRHALNKFTFDDTRSATSSRTSKSKSTKKHRSHSTRKRERGPALERGYSDSFYTNDPPPQPRSRKPPSSPLRFEEDYRRHAQGRELVRRNTDGNLHSTTSTSSRRRHSYQQNQQQQAQQHHARSNSDSHIDMDLAYGELPPPLPARPYSDTQELRGKMTKLQTLLDEANCLQHSVTAMIANLERNPDALAAVALTLAEVSSLVGKMAPGALAAMKGSFPAVVALLASPEFMIAAGVGVGITVVALGGYKIIKKIRQRREDGGKGEDGEGEVEAEGSTEELRELQQEVDSDVSRIEVWRRGIADLEAESVGTSVDGELVTPQARRQLIEEGKLKLEDLKDHDRSETKKSKGKSSAGKSGKTSKTKSRSKERREPSKLRQFFTS
ncbi:hypothetical protein EV356DRAFT_528202 [Viridothelium virens]|uniref:Uncharacterized protein n=1 Tax=Viridothelium virens TaxID=1048519 RepID=A0A6A6HQA1_VIRVR|nr:hypothetical protein EV356DRAFT_528202 [Viridothelium virens]